MSGKSKEALIGELVIKNHQIDLLKKLAAGTLLLYTKSDVNGNNTTSYLKILENIDDTWCTTPCSSIETKQDFFDINNKIGEFVLKPREFFVIEDLIINSKIITKEEYNMVIKNLNFSMQTI